MNLFIKYIGFLGLILCFHFTGAQQQILGNVKNQEGSGIPNATVSVLNSNLGTITDANGAFTLELPAGGYDLSIRAIGYSTTIKSINTADKATM